MTRDQIAGEARAFGRGASFWLHVLGAILYLTVVYFVGAIV